MANVIVTPNMNLPAPVPTVDPGPDYAFNNNLCLTAIDSHNHTTGQGVPIPTGGLNINADLSFAGFNATLLRSVRFNPQGSPLALPTDLGCLYESGIDLYYNDGNGVPIRITQSGGIVGTPGSISGLVPPASATYVSGTESFVWQSAANTAANLDAGSIILRNLTISSFGLTLNPPNAMGADYSLTLPTLPAATSLVTLDSVGNFSTTALTQLLPTGVILPFGGSSPPSGFLVCNGAAVSRTTFAALFSAIGTAYGVGDGSITFNVPDMRGRSPLGSGTGSGLSARTIGQTGGDENLQSHNHGGGGNTGNESAPHFHSFTTAVSPGGLGTLPANGNNSPLNTDTTGNPSTTHTHAFSIPTDGSGSGGNMMPFAVTNFIIKT